MLVWLDSLIHGTLNRPRITIIVPVYGDWTSLSECIASLKECTTPLTKIILVNDCGPEADMLERNIRQSIRGFHNFKYFRNKQNMGFVKTCNRAVLELDKTDNDVLLLNSDTRVTHGFLESMVDALYRADNIASVSPRSNNATVFSIPFEAAEDYSYPPKKSYELYMTIRDNLPEVYETPTTHGFCMLIRRTVIKQLGLFDEIYGKGYGEENDFCLRAKRHGFTHAIANKAYVFHYGSKSFSPRERKRRVAHNEKILKQRYPDYDRLVAEYVRREVLPEQRLFSV